LSDPLSSSDLCVACGLCCDGSVFNMLLLAPDEVTHAIANGLPVTDDGYGIGFWHPCPRLAGTCCTIYDARPGGCRTYRCELLTAFEAGKIDAATAHADVAQARAAAQAVHAALAHPSIPQFRRAMVMSEEAGEPVPRSEARTRLAELDAILNRDFRRKEQAIRDEGA
jgi:uncharacterized protein